MRSIRRATAVCVLTFALLAFWAAPALAEEEPPFWVAVNDSNRVTALVGGQAFFPYVVVHKSAPEVQCFLRIYEVRGPTWTQVRELSLGTQVPLTTYCGKIIVDVPFSYTWGDVDLAPGSYQCKVVATDGIDWAPITHSCGFDVVTTPDVTPPMTTSDYDGLWHSSASATFIIWLTAADDPRGWGLGAGQAKIEISRDGGLSWLPFYYTSTLGVGFPTWKRGGGSGVRNLLYRTTDYAGNVEETKSVDVLIDSRPPQTRDDAPLEPQASDVTVHLTAADSMFGVTACSGVAETRYSVDGGRWVTGTAVRVAAARNAGVHWIAYCSVDNAGNAEYVRQCCVTIAAPSVGEVALSARSSRARR